MLAAVVIPTYNEKNNIQKLIPAIKSQKVGGVKFLLIVVDDNSPDGTAKEAKKFSGVAVISRPSKLGLGSAYLTGFGEAMKLGAEVIFSMDADLSHDFSYAKNFIREIRNGADVVIGSRYVPGGGTNWPISRKIISFGAKIHEVPIFFTDRVFGKSKLRKMEVLKFPLTLLRLRFFS